MLFILRSLSQLICCDDILMFNYYISPGILCIKFTTSDFHRMEFGAKRLIGRFHPPDTGCGSAIAGGTAAAGHGVHRSLVFDQ